MIELGYLQPIVAVQSIKAQYTEMCLARPYSALLAAVVVPDLRESGSH